MMIVHQKKRKQQKLILKTYQIEIYLKLKFQDGINQLSQILQKLKKRRFLLKKTLFEVNNGFNNYLVTPLKNKFVEEGTDSRNIHIFGDDWNVSSKLEKNEKKLLDTDLFIKSMNNTQKYWRSKNYYRMNEMEEPISSERKQVEEPRYYKQYQNPRSLTIYNYEKMKRAKNDLWLEKEKVYKGSVPEKINCIVKKRMFPKYKEDLK